MNDLGCLLDESDPQRWFWWGRAAVLGLPASFLTYFSAPVEKFNSGCGNGGVVFQIGKALNGNVDVERRTIFGTNWDFGNRIGPANFFISFYKSQLAACHHAVDTWSLNIYKDIRVFLGKMIWETRDLALFDVSNEDRPTAVSSPVQKRARKWKILFFEMSVSIQSLFSPDELALEIEWLKARDMLLGENHVKQDVKRALELAAASDHPQCQLLNSLFAEKTLSTVKEAHDVFLVEEKKSPFFCCCALSALGCGALASICWARVLSRTSNDGSDDAWRRKVPVCESCCLGVVMRMGMDGKKIWERPENAISSLLNSAGFVRWMILVVCWMNLILSGGVGVDELRCWGMHSRSWTDFLPPVEEFNSGSGNSGVVFQIGKALNGHVSVEEKTIFGLGNFDNLIGPANFAISFYKSQLSACRRAVDIWSHVGIHCSVVKDIRVLIGKLV
jgi:hypothetical protein